MAKIRIDRGLKHPVTPAVDDDVKIGQEVLVWREKLVENIIG